MADTLPIPVSDLILDEENPRLPEPNVGQRNTQRELARLQQRKLVELADDIVKYGLNLADLPIVMPFDSRRYSVLEGNRRLVAIRALENPDSMVGALTQPLVFRLKKLSADYQQNPIESINCLVVRDKAEADHWRDLRHSGEMEGAGIVGWGAAERARFRARGTILEPHIAALDFLVDNGYLTTEQRRDVPTASLKRLLSSPKVREKLGIDIRDRRLVILGKEEQVAKALLRVVNDLATGKIKTEDIYKKEDRERYADALPPSVAVKAAAKGKGTVITTPTPPKPQRAAPVRLPAERHQLIPRDCALNITDPRINRIEHELRTLNMEEYTNAVAVLYRVFLELSVDTYIARVALPTQNTKPLTTKIMDVANDLVGRKKLNAEQARIVRHAAHADSFLAPSTTLLNTYVHSAQIFPAAGDLRAHWNSLQPFFIAMWTP